MLRSCFWLLNSLFCTHNLKVPSGQGEVDEINSRSVVTQAFLTVKSTSGRDRLLT